MTVTSTTRTLPTAGTYRLDPAHSHVGFRVRHLMVAKVRGRFGQVDATVTVADEPLESAVTVSIDAASIDTRDENRDEHLRSPDFLDVARHPALEFRSTALREIGGGTYAVDGELTIRGVTRPVTLDARLDGVGSNTEGVEVAFFSASTRIDREDFGLTWNQALETGGVLVGREVDIEIEAEVVRQA